jgi:hypothetical protein
MAAAAAAAAAPPTTNSDAYAAAPTPTTTTTTTVATVAAMTTATMAAASATMTATMTATVTTVAAAMHEFNVRGRGLFFVENIEGRQADVGNFFNTKNFLRISDRGRRHGCCGFTANHCSTGQRQRGPDQRYCTCFISVGSSLGIGFAHCNLPKIVRSIKLTA